jgi:hypothetical protein
MRTRRRTCPVPGIRVIHNKHSNRHWSMTYVAVKIPPYQHPGARTPESCGFETPGCPRGYFPPWVRKKFPLPHLYKQGECAYRRADSAGRCNVRWVLVLNRPVSVYRFPRRALTLCPQPCIGIQPGASFPARSADALPATLYGRFNQAIYRNRPVAPLPGCAGSVRPGCRAADGRT